MPTMRRKRRPRPRQRAAVSYAMRDYLASGSYFGFLDDRPEVDEPSETEARAAWAACRDDILAVFERDTPGRRPYAWWRFESSEPRRRLDRKERPGRGELRFGVPRFLRTSEDFLAEYESEEAYLRRLGLLTATERRTLAHPYKAVTDNDVD